MPDAFPKNPAVVLPPLDDLPASVRPVADAYAEALNAWRDAHDAVDDHPASVAAANLDDAKRLQAAALAGDDLSTLELSDPAEHEAEEVRLRMVESARRGAAIVRRDELHRALLEVQDAEQQRAQHALDEVGDGYRAAFDALRVEQRRLRSVGASALWWHERITDGELGDYQDPIHPVQLIDLAPDLARLDSAVGAGLSSAVVADATRPATTAPEEAA